MSGSEVANFAHSGDSTNLQEAPQAYRSEKQSSVKAITSINRDNVEARDGIKVRTTKALDRLNLLDQTGD